MPSAAFQAALEETVAKYERRLVGYAFRVLGDREEARDAAQEALMKLCRVDPVQFESEIAPKLEAWIFTVCRNAAFDRLRKKRHSFLTKDGDFDQSASVAIER